MTDELNFPKAKYQCICSDCKHVFMADKMPLRPKSTFDRIFGRKKAQTDDSENAEHRAPAFSVDSLKAEKALSAALNVADSTFCSAQFKIKPRNFSVFPRCHRKSDKALLICNRRNFTIKAANRLHDIVQIYYHSSAP